MSEVEAIYTEITQTRTDKPWSKTFPAILKKIMSLEQAELVLAMPGTTEELIEKTAMPAGQVRELLQDMFLKGIALGEGENLAEPEKHGWVFPKHSGFLRDLIGSSGAEYIDSELQELYWIHEEEFFGRRQSAYENEAKRDRFISALPNMRVIPKWRSIESIPGILPIEDVREIFRAAPQIAIIDCPCKALTRDFDRDSTEVPLESCIVGLGVAKFELKRGTAREMSFDEAIICSDKLDQAKLVTMVDNNNKMPYGTCNCAPDTCMLFVTADADKKRMGFDSILIAKSRFAVVLNPEKCEGCGVCSEERCPVDAVTMKDYPEYGEKRAAVDPEGCLGCGLCVITCPGEALKMKLVRPPEHIPTPREVSGAEGAQTAVSPSNS